jgi:C1A family cysteine protease
MKYSWKPDIPDARDRYFLPKAQTIPKFAHRLGLGNRVEDQGTLNSCTGNASTSALEIVLGLNTQLSRLMAYYNGRLVDGYQRTDEGAYIRSVIKGLMKQGVATESKWPYVAKKVNVKPVKAAQEDGQVFKANYTKDLEYARVESLADMKIALSQKCPVVFGFAVHESFEALPKSGLLELPKQGEANLGGHAVVAVGFDDRPKKPFIWVRNSWGPDWAINGYFKMTQDWFTDKRRLVDDLWLVRRVTN